MVVIMKSTNGVSEMKRYKVGEDKKRDKTIDDLFAQIWNLNQSADRGPDYKAKMAELCNAIHNS
jgi:hypothetical protein